MNEKEKAEAYVRSKCPELIVDIEERPWEEDFYESSWNVDTVKVMPHEEAFMEDMSYFMPRHMQVYDWNLPYNEFILLKIRRHFPPKIELQHWLRVLETLEVEIGYYKHIDYGVGTLTFTLAEGHPLINKIVTFNLTTGQPTTEADYKAFNQIVGI